MLDTARVQAPVSALPRIVEQSARNRWRDRFAPGLAVLAGMAAISAHAALYGRWIVDDAAITFSYARSVSEGMGPVLQPGATPVEGYSDPTWMVLLALGRLAGAFDHGLLLGIPDYVLFPKALGLVFVAGILLACHHAAAQVCARFAALVTLAIGLGLAAIPSFVIWCVSGLENGLFAFLVVWLAVLLWVAVLRSEVLRIRVALLAGLLVALAALTRPEGLIYGAAYPLVVLLALRRGALRAALRPVGLFLAAFGIPFGGYETWRVVEFGSLLATPSIAKSQGLPTVASLTRPIGLVHYVGIGAVVVAALLVGFALYRAPWRRALTALLVPLALAVIAYGVLMPDWMTEFRFATPVWPLAMLATVLSAAEFLRRSSKLRGAVLLLVVLSSGVPTGAGFLADAQQFQHTPTLPACTVADLFGRGFNSYADILGIKHGSLLLPDLGGTAMTSRLRLVDMAGLTQPHIAELIKTHNAIGLRDYVFNTIKPTFIHSWGPWAAGNGITSDPRLARDYVPIIIYPHESPPNGAWVRRDAVPNATALRAVRHFAAATMMPIAQRLLAHPLGDCGSRMRPGQPLRPG
ncbi:MAG: hypothetical protein ACRDRL_30005 [Sciscionella sp.]